MWSHFLRMYESRYLQCVITSNLINENYFRDFFSLRISLGDTDRHASLSLRLIKMAAPCCNLAMASCLCCLSNRKWPPFCCCCRLKAHRLARCLKPPFWSQRTESRQQRREGLKGGHGAEVRHSTVVVMAKEQWGKMAGEEERIKRWGSYVRKAAEPPLLGVREALAEGLSVAAWPLKGS